MEQHGLRMDRWLYNTQNNCIVTETTLFLLSQELAIVRVKYSNLEKQYRSVASMAKRDEESIAAQMEDVNKDVEILREEKDKLKEEMATWEKDFKERTGQEPSEEDRYCFGKTYLKV